MSGRSSANVLRAAGLLDESLDSSGFMTFGDSGRGSWITINGYRGRHPTAS